MVLYCIILLVCLCGLCAFARGSGSPSLALPETVAPPVPAQVDPGRERIYYPQLDGLRFVAFFLVYLFHGGIPEFSGWVNGLVRGLAGWLPGGEPWAKADWGGAIRGNGWVGVQLFFILSGYLITMLLLREEDRFGRIDLPAFWVRRILRIWPLYYLVVFLGFFVLAWIEGALPHEAYIHRQLGQHLPAFLVFLGNWSMGLIGPVWNDALSVLWSVCVEEQFYLLCPILIAWVPSRGRALAVVGLMIASITGRSLLARANVNPLLFQFSTITQLDTLLSGVLLALVLHRFPPGERASRWAAWLQWPVWVGALWLLTRQGLAHGSTFDRTWAFVGLWLVGVGIVALIVVRHGWPYQVLSHRWLVWLGRVSYGLYMYHEITLWFGRKIANTLGWFPNKELLTTAGCLALTIGTAGLSYYAFERPFLRWKRSWTRVPSRPV